MPHKHRAQCIDCSPIEVLEAIETLHKEARRAQFLKHELQETVVAIVLIAVGRCLVDEKFTNQKRIAFHSHCNARHDATEDARRNGENTPHPQSSRRCCFCTDDTHRRYTFPLVVTRPLAFFVLSFSVCYRIGKSRSVVGEADKRPQRSLVTKMR